MGGKVWSKLEERIFWSVLAKLAPPGLHKESKAVKKSLKDLKKSWKPLVEAMDGFMGKQNPGKTLPRKYTEVSMYEHYFQNFVQGKLSPNAGEFVEEYKAWLKNKAEHPESDAERPVSMPQDVAPQLVTRQVKTPQGRIPPSARPSNDGSSQSRDLPRPGLPTTHVDDQLPQSAGLQVAYDGPPPPNCHPPPSSRNHIAGLKRDLAELKAIVASDRTNIQHHQISDFSGQEHPSKRPRMMDNGQRDINMSAHMSVLLAQHDTSGGDQFSGFPPAGTGLSNLDGVDQASNNRNANPFVQHHTSGGGQFPGVPHNMQYPAGRGFLDPSSAHFGSNDQSFNFAAMQNTIGIAQYLQAMHSMQGPPYHNSWGHTNMVQGYPGPQTGHFGAQSNVHHSMGHYAAQPSHDTITGPNGQNNFQPCMGYDAAQFNHSTGTGRGDA